MTDSNDRRSLRPFLAEQISEGKEIQGLLDTQDATIRVTIHTETGSLEEAKQSVEAANGTVIAGFDTLIHASVPTGAITELANSRSIRVIGEYFEPQTLAVGPTTSSTITNTDDQKTEGIDRSRIRHFHDLGITGTSATIAILDTQFDIENAVYEEQVVGTLGDPDDGTFDDAYRRSGGHGDAVTEIVSHIAPDASLILGDTFQIPDLDLFNALDELEGSHPETAVVNYSVGHAPDLRIDGQDPYSNRIAEFCEDGDRLFVCSAGNSGAVESTWALDSDDEPTAISRGFGDAYDSQGDAVFETVDGRELLAFDANFSAELPVSTRLPIHTDVSVVYHDEDADSQLGGVFVHWDADPEIDDQDYEARLFAHLDADEPLVTSRTKNPWEAFTITAGYFRHETLVTINRTDDEWIVESVDGPDVVVDGESGNPTLEFLEGIRYTITNAAWPEDPLEFTDGNVIMLSQDPDITGEYEEDTLVNWDAEEQTIAFTMNRWSGLASDLTNYRVAGTETDGSTVETDGPLPVALEVERMDADESHHFDVWALFDDVHIEIPWATDERSVGIPALGDDANLLSIAAVQAVDLNETGTAFAKAAGDLKPYSSQGPTQDGRAGIDLAASAHVSTTAVGSVEDTFGFNGTSAAAPHVTGAIGLLVGIGDLSTAEIRSALFASGTSIEDSRVGEPGTDNTHIGHGELSLDGTLEMLLSPMSALVSEWDFELGHRVQNAHPLIKDESVIASSLSSTIVAIDRETGAATEWVITRDGSLSDASAITDGEKTYIVGGDGTVRAVDDSEEGWDRSYGSAMTATPAIGDEILVIGTNDGRVIGLDTSGEERWMAAVDGPVYADIAVDGTLSLVVTAEGHATILAISDGSTVTEIPDATSGMSIGGLLIDDVAYVANESLRAVDPTESGDERVRWEQPLDGTALATPVTDPSAEVLFVVTDAGTVGAFNRSDGSPLWNTTDEATPSAKPAVVGEGIAVGLLQPTNDSLTLLDTIFDPGSILDQVSLGGNIRSSPTVADDFAAVGTEVGELVGISLSAEDPE